MKRCAPIVYQWAFVSWKTLACVQRFHLRGWSLVESDAPTLYLWATEHFWTIGRPLEQKIETTKEKSWKIHS